jgi:hypothetical protein
MLRKLIFTSAALVLSASAPPLQAQIYKCTVAGKVTYANTPCDSSARPAQLKGNVTTVDNSHLRKAAATKQEAQAGKTIAGVKIPNPVAECKAKGGTIDKELRACMLP